MGKETFPWQGGHTKLSQAAIVRELHSSYDKNS